MERDDDAVTVAAVREIDAVDPAGWDRCVGASNPFMQRRFLHALERSGSVAPKTGWSPAHLTASHRGGLVGAVPAYVKSHSYGEYVFDHAWADAYERAGGRYYPKLQVCVPFTPVPGPRLATAADAPPETAGVLATALESLAAANGFSSVHVAFADQPSLDALLQAGWLHRTGMQYHWFNRGYGDFDDFLDATTSRKRKQIKRERREVAESSVEIHKLTGDDLRPEHWDAFYDLYMQTADRKWGGGYLTRAFFHMLGETMAEQTLLVMCRDRGRWIAGALNLIGDDALYGRNWGSDGSHPFLHFEACYYAAVEFAVARGLQRVEAGAQGEHKVQRGYEPVATHSAHWIADSGLRRAVDRFLTSERAHIAAAMAELSDLLPYKK